MKNQRTKCSECDKVCNSKAGMTIHMNAIHLMVSPSQEEQSRNYATKQALGLRYQPKIDVEKIQEEQERKAIMDCGRWIAERIIENGKLFRGIPPMLYSYYMIYLQEKEKERRA